VEQASEEAASPHRPSNELDVGGNRAFDPEEISWSFLEILSGLNRPANEVPVIEICGVRERNYLII